MINRLLKLPIAAQMNGKSLNSAISRDVGVEAYVVSNDQSLRDENQIKFRPWLSALNEIFGLHENIKVL